MKAYQNERRENAISYIAREHRKKTGFYPYQTHLYKYLGMFEYRVLRELGYLPLGFTYMAMERGPVPAELYSRRYSHSSGLYEFSNQGDGRIDVRPKQRADMDYFSEDERRILDRLIFELTRDRKKFSANAFSDRSHEDVRAWREAWRRRPSQQMEPTDEFPEIDAKAEDELTDAEEHFLIEQSMAGADR